MVLAAMAAAAQVSCLSAFELTGYACGPNGECLDNYVCSPVGMCVQPIPIGCDGDGLCPTDVSTGDSCSEESSFIPCADPEDLTCTNGCRVCTGGRWGECSACELGTVNACASCSDDCTEVIANATAVCNNGVCEYQGDCEDGAVDLDGERGNGCECAISEEIVCNGADEDCDGQDLVVTGVDTSCAACGDDCTGLPAIEAAHCDTSDPTPLCVIDTCLEGYRDENDLPGDGCEDPCPAEVCNGVDDDCDGEADETDDVSVVCDLDHPIAVDVQAWGCDGSECVITACLPSTADDNGSAGDGCEAVCTPTGSETCDGSDNDCNGMVDDVPEGGPGCTDFFADADGDGHGDPARSECRCVPIGVFTATSGDDCDDDLAACGSACAPGRSEVCDGWDNDCSDAGAPPDDELDDDGDGYVECTDYVDNGAGFSGGDDCADDPTAGCGVLCNPGATQVCDGFDNDCSNGGVPVVGEVDDDGDGFVECGDYVDRGAGPSGGGDCADDPGSGCGADCFPGATEACDGYDTGCLDGGVPNADETDDDGDGYAECTGYVEHGAGLDGGGDCADDPAAGCGADCHPGAAEVCDGQDTNCSGAMPPDERDDDGDGYLVCSFYSEHGAGFVGGDDCADDPVAGCGVLCNPGLPEECDGYDNDCDGGGVPPAGEQDNDGDGFIACSGPYVERGFGYTLGECDDSIPTCTTDCSTNGDAAEAVVVPDCAEVYCGTDPANALDACTIVDDEAGAGALDVADSTVLLGTFTNTADRSVAAGVTVRQKAGAVITVTSNRLFDVNGAGVTIDGVHAVGSNASMIHTDGADTVVQNCILEGYTDRAVEVHNVAGVVIRNNIIIGGNATPANTRAGIYFDGGTDAQVVGNLIVQNRHDGIQLRGTARVTIDHNTVADNGRGAVRFVTNTSNEVCIRNNVFAENGWVAVVWAIAPGTWGAGAGCASASSNLQFNAMGQCVDTTDSCSASSACDCFLDSSFWGPMLDPAFTDPPQELGDEQLYCLGEATLLDAAPDRGWDLNGADAGRYNGAGPDYGAREAGSWGCP